ncbi:hypothetical protein ITP53_41710 [Nonomuraea sp. K274]|uniref:Uncharacterized protein n=1 Tax=Nonomuraea cypriaca TaxID=1187855 RepID=A0A931AI46_9ACTN|nr:hypothetical protein [Nonomuraea cypriaca]MBF8192090.1 hypothetical protein [Nonomuraea cypriaca]
MTPFNIDPGRDRLLAWMRAHDIDPRDTYRVELILTDALAVKARVYHYDLDEQGRKRLLDSSEIARREPFDVPLFTFDGRAVAERMQEIGAAARAVHDALLPLIVIMRAHMRTVRTDYRRRQIARRKRRR